MAGGGHKKGWTLDNRPLCSFCSKPGYLVDACWLKHSEKKRSYHAKGRGLPRPTLPLNNITTSSLQAMISQAVENVLASANKSWQFGRLCYISPLVIPSSIPNTSASLSPFNNNDKDYQNVSHSYASHNSSNYLKTTRQHNKSLYMLKSKISTQHARI